jgi:hypothetical protein
MPRMRSSTLLDRKVFQWVTNNFEGALGSTVGSGAMLQVGRSRVRFLMRSLDFSNDLILPAALWSWGRLRL